jgi:hypothetical protein
MPDAGTPSDTSSTCVVIGGRVRNVPVIFSWDILWTAVRCAAIIPRLSFPILRS